MDGLLPVDPERNVTGLLPVIQFFRVASCARVLQARAGPSRPRDLLGPGRGAETQPGVWAVPKQVTKSSSFSTAAAAVGGAELVNFDPWAAPSLQSCWGKPSHGAAAAGEDGGSQLAAERDALGAWVLSHRVAASAPGGAVGRRRVLLTATRPARREWERVVVGGGQEEGR